MSSVWQQYEGGVINDRYRLGELLHTEDSTAIFQTEAGAERAVVHLVHVDPDHSNYYLSRWKQVSRLTNPHILRVLDSGDASTPDESVVFLVTEEPDDILGSVLAERPLTEPETREVVESIADALDALHRSGLTHGNLSPATVFAVGNQIKISGDGLRMAAGSSAADDIHAMGTIVVSCLKQQAPPSEDLLQAADGLPEPYKAIALRSLDPDPQARWTAARILSELKGGVRKTSGTTALPAEERSSERTPGSTVKYAAVTAAAILLAIIGYEWMKPKEAPPQPVSTYVEPKPAPSQPLHVAVPPVQQAPVRRTATPPPRAESGRSRVVAPVQKAPAANGGHLVIVATYNRLQDAEKRAHSLTSRFPKFPATVIAPQQPNPPYFVTIGSNLSKDDAVRLQKRARSAGLPRDTYVTR